MYFMIIEQISMTSARNCTIVMKLPVFYIIYVVFWLYFSERPLKACFCFLHVM